MQNYSCPNVESPCHELPIASVEYSEDALRVLFSSHLAGLAGVVFLDRIADGEKIIVRKEDGTIVALAEKEEARRYLRQTMGWT